MDDKADSVISSMLQDDVKQNDSCSEILKLHERRKSTMLINDVIAEQAKMIGNSALDVR